MRCRSRSKSNKGCCGSNCIIDPTDGGVNSCPSSAPLPLCSHDLARRLYQLAHHEVLVASSLLLQAEFDKKDDDDHDAALPSSDRATMPVEGAAASEKTAYHRLWSAVVSTQKASMTGSPLQLQIQPTRAKRRNSKINVSRDLLNQLAQQVLFGGPSRRSPMSLPGTCWSRATALSDAEALSLHRHASKRLTEPGVDVVGVLAMLHDMSLPIISTAVTPSS